jgi:hypothetical protein
MRLNEERSIVDQVVEESDQHRMAAEAEVTAAHERLDDFLASPEATTPEGAETIAELEAEIKDCERVVWEQTTSRDNALEAIEISKAHGVGL